METHSSVRGIWDPDAAFNLGDLAGLQLTCSDSRQSEVPRRKLIERLVTRYMLPDDAYLFREPSETAGTTDSESEESLGLEEAHEAIGNLRIAAVALPNLPNDLFRAHYSRFQRFGELSDLNKAVRYGAQALSLYPGNYVDKPVMLNNLGLAYETRFSFLGDISDLSKAIRCEERSLSLTPNGYPDKASRLSNIGISYRRRFESLGNVADIKQAVECSAMAISLTPCSDPSRAGYISNLGIAHLAWFDYLGDISHLSKAIERQKEAVLLTPDGDYDKPGRLHNLATSFQARYDRLEELSDLSESITYEAQAVSLMSDDRPDKPMTLHGLGGSYLDRFDRLGNLLDLFKAIKCGEQAVQSTPNEHQSMPVFLNCLGNSYLTRFERLDRVSDLREAIDCITKAVSLASEGHPGRRGYLNSLANAYRHQFKLSGHAEDLSKAIECGAQVVSLTRDGQPAQPGYLSSFGVSYFTRFEYQKDISDLDKAIEYADLAVSLTPDDHSSKTGYLSNLGILYQARFETLRQSSDMQLAMSAFRKSSHLPTGSPSIRFRACRQWARLSALDTLSDPRPAYSQGMKLLPQLLWIGTTVDQRYELVRDARDFATEAASHAIHCRDYELAVEWLEAGRSIVWGQIAQLRSPFDQIVAHDPDLANKLREVGRKLDHASTQHSFLSTEDSEEQSMIDEANTRIQLAVEWDILLARARTIPGLEKFLCAVDTSSLLDAASTHPIAIINTHESRCDALILLPGSKSISHVPLPDFSISSATTARERLVTLVGHRGFVKAGRCISSVNMFDQLAESLKSLWWGVVKPVLDFLGFTHSAPIDKLPCITWCTTGVLSFLPLHAAGCYNRFKSNAFDRVVSSYTPTLSALLPSRSSGPQNNTRVLAVGQVNAPGFSSLPYVSDELKSIKHHLHDKSYVQLDGRQATVSRVLDAMKSSSWVHLACHGTQHLTDPTQNAFHLCDGPLTLTMIMKQSFTNKGLAFLSACHTATGSEELPDEAAHLAAGMLMAGYPSVIGTMWGIADEDGPEVADRVYAELLKDGTLDHRNAARALHQAVAGLRAKVGKKAVTRWAPFIHIGL